MATTTLTQGIEAYQTDITFGDGIDVTGTTTLGSSVNSLFVKHVAHVTGVTVNSTAGDSPAIGIFAQPAGTVITDIKIFCVTAPVTALILQTQDATTAPVSVQYAAAARNIFCNITNTENATTAGSFTFVIEYVQVA